MAILFQDGLEGGLTPWSGTYQSYGSVAVVTNNPRTGLNSAYFLASGAGTPWVELRRTLSSEPTVYAAGWFYIPQTSLDPLAASNNVTLIRFNNSGNAILAGAQILRTANTPARWRVAGSTTSVIGSNVGAGNAWFFVQLGYSNGTVTLWVNGQQVATLTETPNALPLVTRAIFGMMENNLPAIIDGIYLDDVTIAQEYITEVLPTPNLIIDAKLTDGTPLIGVAVYVDGIFKGNTGTTPLVIPITAGTHTVKVDAEITT